MVLALYTAGASTAPVRAPLLVPRSAAEARFRFEPVQPELLGQGGSFANAWADYDGDGDLDLFVGFGGATPNRLYRNDHGKLTEVGAAAGVADARATRSSAWGDFDADGDPDFFVAFRAAPRAFYRSQGGRFAHVAAEVGRADTRKSVGAVWFDF